jgi:acetolactate synthase I/II/III large subunit
VGRAGGALLALGRIAAAAGVQLICEGPFSRVDRGAGHPRISRLPYFPQEAQKLLRSFQVLVLAGARAPVAQFGYRWAG